MAASPPPLSPNFAFLRCYDLDLVRFGSLAESYFKDDPNTCIIKLRQFGELLAQLIAARVGLYQDVQENQASLLNRLKWQGVLEGKALDLFHQLRQAGNDAVHHNTGDHGLALSCLKNARSLGIWFHQAYGQQPNFKAGPFVPPTDPVEPQLQDQAALTQELNRLRQELEQYRAHVEVAQAAVAEEMELRQLAEELLQATEAEAEARKAQLEQLQAESSQKSPKKLTQLINTAKSASYSLELDERETRILIDEQLRSAGWTADTEKLRYSQGTRPERGKALAIAEWPTAEGRADYALFIGLTLVAVVEAKRQTTSVSGALTQAKRYSRGFRTQDGATTAGGPWGEYRVPFAFATNGRDYLEQLRTESGIWFVDLRRSTNLSRSLPTWYSPQDLQDLLNQDQDAAQARLGAEGFDYGFELRGYQKQAIQTIEAALSNDDRRALLLAMATGTGKTKTAIALIYRLLKTQRFRRILFLVDRSALGEQAHDAFQETRMESAQTFAKIFELKGLTEKEPERETKVQIATVQSMVKRLLYPTDPAQRPTAGQYDCIVVDECHRGYLLDREMSDTEQLFRDQKDYISKYRRVLEFFDAVKIGLTATPALHTSQIFGAPVFTYSYRDAVIDGFLIDHEPPHRIETELSRSGLTWKKGEQVEYLDPKTGEKSFAQAPDEIRVGIEQFNRQAIAPAFNQTVCRKLAELIDPNDREMGKTLVFCVNDKHADFVVDELKQAFAAQYGAIEDDAVVKITGATDRYLQMIRRFKNEVNPRVAVTVDLLTTGIDVPEICNLVFLRQVKSRILYEQMVGRATRLCDDINKEVFRIFDAVQLYDNIQPYTAMQPVAVNPKLSFGQLTQELATVTEPEAQKLVLEQFLAKLQRKRRHLSQTQREAIADLAGLEIEDLIAELRVKSPAAAADWIQGREELGQWLDRREGERRPLLISHQDDQVVAVGRGYGQAARPQDYLDGFNQYIRENLNQIPALMIVAQRPW
ncbi:MAG: type I restriction-modification system endonuclease, partial [Prochlorothrix sp.]